MRKFVAAVRAADLVVAGNRSLARLARESGGEPIIVPTVVDPARYARTEPRPMRTVPVVGWIGTAANFPYLEAAAPAIARARRAHPFEFTVMAESPPPMRDAIFVPWSAPEEPRFLHSLDIGLMPLTDDAWCRGKCGAKALQYMAAEVPVVASAVGDTELIVGPGGHVVRTFDQFADALATLLPDAEERARVGAAGRRHVEKNFDPGRWVGRLVDAYFGSNRER